jgi:copper(I)-binding protein
MQSAFRSARTGRILGSLAALALAGAAFAAHAQVDVSNAWVRGTVPAQTASGAFMTLHAHQDAKLVGVSSPVATAELHEMSMEGNVMRMRAIPSLALPAMQNVDLKPGGYHIMLMGLKAPLKSGDSVPITLKIEQGGKVIEKQVTAQVRDMTASGSTGAMGGMAGHGDHQH